MNKMLSTAILLLPLASSACLAADLRAFDAKLGLWETTATTEMEGMPAMPAMPQIPKETLDKMPPAQRAQMEAMMKGRGNLGAPRTMTNKSCITKESIEKGYMMGDSKEANCTRQVISATSSKAQVHVECSPAGGAKSVGDMTMERIDSDHMKGNMVMKTTAADHAMTIKVNYTSKWLSSDCGDLKPFTAK
jgi:Protein of unknown function (DUF3617)